MMSRLVLEKKERKTLFKELKNYHKTKTQKELAKKLGVSKSCLKKWKIGSLLIPAKIIPKEIFKSLKIIETKEDNWGAKKGGSISIRKIMETNPEEIIRRRRIGGLNSIGALNKRLKKMYKNDPDKLYMLLREKKLKEKLKNIKKFEMTPKKIELKTEIVKFSHTDKKRKITLPQELDENLAEEIGIHLGDGTLPEKKYYFSVRGSELEEGYYLNHVLPLYKKIYNIDLKLLRRSPICGFETSSKAIYEFKSKVLGLQTGVKTYKIDVPDIIIESCNRKIMGNVLRGLFDTDGCIYFHKKRRYPVISIGIKSKKIIRKIGTILKILGFIPSTSYKHYRVALNGTIMLKKWMEEIGTKNPKHQKRFEKIKKMLPWSNLDKLFMESEMFSI